MCARVCVRVCVCLREREIKKERIGEWLTDKQTVRYNNLPDPLTLSNHILGYPGLLLSILFFFHSLFHSKWQFIRQTIKILQKKNQSYFMRSRAKP